MFPLWGWMNAALSIRVNPSQCVWETVIYSELWAIPYFAQEISLYGNYSVVWWWSFHIHKPVAISLFPQSPSRVSQELMPMLEASCRWGSGVTHWCQLRAQSSTPSMEPTCSQTSPVVKQVGDRAVNMMRVFAEGQQEDISASLFSLVWLLLY